MKSLWSKEEAKKLNNDPLQLRVYSSRLLGQEGDLVLHGGGNTSVKTKLKNIFGEEEDILYVKGSGWDLATIEPEGFAPVKLKVLTKMAQLEQLSDTDMVKYQRAAMTSPSAPNPSVEAILHAIIPYAYVDHTHADAVVTISNTPDGEKRIRELYGHNMLIIPYVMPGFILAKTIYELTKGINWDGIEGMILMNHGVFTFHDDAQVSYEKMIEVVNKAEKYLEQYTNVSIRKVTPKKVAPISIASLRNKISKKWGRPVLVQFNNSNESIAFSQHPDLTLIANKGPLTPDHIIRTKRTPIILSEEFEEELETYTNNYRHYFNEFANENHTCLDPAPRWAIWPNYGALSFGVNIKNNTIIQDISQHTMKAILQAEQLGGWKALDKEDLFEMEYWVLEQEKLKKGGNAKPMQGQIALVTGAASGIGYACVQKLLVEGAVVVALDINPEIHDSFLQEEVLTIECDVTQKEQIKTAVQQAVSHFGGLDMLISNAGIFPQSFSIDQMDEEIWDKSMEVNLTSHQQLVKVCTPFLSVGINPSIVFIGSKNVPAPGPGAAAYSVAKAGLTQLGRIAALELGKKGIRVNTVHPNAVFDTGIWNEEVITTRAKNYGLTKEEYKANNTLKVEITSQNVAQIVVTLLGNIFSVVTGVQLPIDGGNERTI